MRVLYQFEEVDGNRFRLLYQELGKRSSAYDRNKPRMKSLRGKFVYKNGIMMFDCMNSEGNTYTPYAALHGTGSVAGMRKQFTHWEKGKVIKAHGYYYNTSTVQVWGCPIRLLAYALEQERFPYLKDRKDQFILEYHNTWDLKLHETVKIKTYGGDNQRREPVTAR